jgi:hypothetical protein
MAILSALAQTRAPHALFRKQQPWCTTIVIIIIFSLAAVVPLTASLERTIPSPGEHLLESNEPTTGEDTALQIAHWDLEAVEALPSADDMTSRLSGSTLELSSA